MLRALRLVGAAACLTLCVLLVILWMRSYSHSDNLAITHPTSRSVTIDGQTVATFHLLALDTCRGQLGVSGGLNIPKDESVDRFPWFEWRSHEPPFTNAWWGWPADRTSLGLMFLKFLPGWYGTSAPFWLLTLLVGVAGLALSMKPPYRFTIRGALVATTIAVIVLAFGVAFA